MNVTMLDVAKRCGVSKSLVSRILNADPTLRIPQETRRRVLATVEEMGYAKNFHAQALAIARQPKSDKVLRLGYITFSARMHPGHPYFSQIINGITEEIARNDALLAFSMSSTEVREALEELVAQYKDNPLDGLILLGDIDDKAMRTAIRKIAKNIVSMDGQFDANSDYVGTDTSKSILLAVNHLLEMGYTDFGLVYGRQGRRLEACRKHLAQSGATLQEEWVINGEYTANITFDRVAAVLKTAKPPRAIVACNDEMAMGCVRALLESGYRVPEDVAVTGHDDIFLAPYVDVPLTTVHIYKKEMGRLAVKLVLDRIENKRKTVALLELPGKLIRRDSCGYKTKHSATKRRTKQ